MDTSFSDGELATIVLFLDKEKAEIKRMKEERESEYVQ